MRALLLLLGLLGQTFEVKGPDDVAINTQIKAAVSAGGGIVHLRGGRYTLNAPLSIRDCSGVTLRGDGPSTILGTGGYAGPLIAVGLPLGSTELSRRPASPLFTVAPKRSIATLGNQALAITGNPLQFGWVSPANQPDYWGGSAPITWDLAISKPAGPDWVQWAPIAGLGDSWQNPAPWLFRWADGGLVLDIRLEGDTQFHRLAIPLDPTKPFWRVTAQYDPSSGRVAAWADGLPVASAFVPGWGLNGGSRKLVRHDGMTPFMIAYAGPRMDAQPGAGITNVNILGLRICRSAVYRWDGPQTFAVNPALALSDDTRYFSAADQVIPAGSLVALLPLDPEPDGSPWVSVMDKRGRGLLAWLPPITTLAVGTNRIAIEDMTLGPAVQPGILMGRHSAVALRRLVISGGSQAIGSMPLMTSYPLTIDDCDVSGWDVPIFSFWQMISARNLIISGCGRNGIRTAGGDCLWDWVRVWRLGPYCESVFRHVGGDDGLTQEYRRVLIDNEDYAPSDAFLDVEQGSNQRGSLTVNGLGISALAPDSALIRLTGRGIQAAAPYKIDARGLTAFGTCPVGLRVKGEPAWHGTVDLSQLSPGAVDADPGTADAINVVKPTKLFPAPAAP